MKGKYMVIGIIIILISFNVSGSLLEKSDFKKTTTNILNGNILYVGGSGAGNYSTIQGAINAAVDGDTVYVYDDSSPYIENIVIDKSISLIGENKLTTVIRGIGGYYYYYYEVVSATGPNIVISDFTIQNGVIGVFCDIDDSEISNLIISETVCALYIWTSSNNIFSDNFIDSCEGYGIFMYDHSADNLIVNNSFTDVGQFGIYLLSRCDNNRIENNLIEDKEDGVFIDWCFFNFIRKNNFVNNVRQAYFDNSSFNFFFRNYWDDWEVKKPRPIDGLRYSYLLQNNHLWKTYDLLPAQEPYDI